MLKRWDLKLKKLEREGYICRWLRWYRNKIYPYSSMYANSTKKFENYNFQKRTLLIFWVHAPYREAHVNVINIQRHTWIFSSVPFFFALWHPDRIRDTDIRLDNMEYSTVIRMTYMSVPSLNYESGMSDRFHPEMTKCGSYSVSITFKTPMDMCRTLQRGRRFWEAHCASPPIDSLPVHVAS